MAPDGRPADRGCPRTGGSRAGRLAPGATRPSDLLVVFFSLGVGWLVAAAITGVVAAVTGEHHARWLALHFAFVGGVSQLVVGAAQFFVCAFLATDPPSRRMVRAQLVVWNAGTVAIGAGVPTGAVALTGIGGTLVLIGLALLALALRAMERRSLQRARWAARWYYAAAAFLAAGAVLGPLMASGAAWTHGSLVGAHLVLNLGGWFGTAIVGTLHTFHPSLTGTRLQRPGLQGPTFTCWIAGIAASATGCASGSTLLALAGWAALGVAAAMLAVNVVAGERAATQRTVAGSLVGAAQALLVAAVATAVALTASDGAVAAVAGPHRDVLAVLAVAGWIGATVLGSLLHLLRLMARVRRLDRPALAPRAGGRAAAAVATLVVAVVVALAGGRLAGAGGVVGAATAALVVVYAVIAARVVQLAVRALRAAPLHV